MGTLKRCVIVGGGECSPKFLKDNIKCDDYVVCADSGYDIVSKCGFLPKLLIGDFDSIKAIPQGIEIITLPIEKDVTDCEAAIIECINRDFNEFVLFGGTGGRFEHTFANVTLIAKYTKLGYKVEMIDDIHHFYCIHNNKLSIDYKENQQISVFAFGNKAYGVTENGFHYPLADYTLDPYVPLGISNDIIADKGEISVEDGTLIIIETIM